CGADLARLRKRLAKYLDDKIERMPGNGQVSPRYALGVQRVLQRAAAHVQSANRQEINGGHVLVAMFAEPDSYAVYFLQEEEVTRFDVVNFISHGVSKVGADDDPKAAAEEGESDEEEGEEGGPGRKQSPAKALQSYAVNLNEKAAKGLIDPL